MRKLVLGTLMAAMALGMVPARAENKTTTGGVLVPTTILSRTHRCAYTAGGEDTQGLTGYTIAVSGGGTFTLKAVGANSDVNDFDVSFHSKLTECDQGAAVVGDYVNHNKPVDDTNDEAGEIPEDAQVAVINLFAGAGGTFEFVEIPAAE